MSIEDKLPNDITPVYAANNFAQVLELLPPKPIKYRPTNLTLGEKVLEYVTGMCLVGVSLLEEILPKSKEQKQQEESERQYLERVEESEQEEKEEFIAAGIDTEQKMYAWTIAHYTGLCMKRQARLRNNNTIDLPIDTFERYVSSAVRDGIRAVRGGSRYLAAKEVNPDFETKATDWLLNEVYSRKGNKFEVLSSVRLKQEEDYITMTKMRTNPEDWLK